MPSKRELCRNWKLYVIVDAEAARGRDLAEITRRAIKGGADVIQLRDKKASDEILLRGAKALLTVTQAAGVPLIINDRVPVAQAAGADGVHLGQEDGTLREARQILGEEALIGRSTHSPEQALGAQKEGFDYIGIGPVFQTPTKPGYKPVGLELVRFAAEHISVPFVAIGGIGIENADLVKRAGAKAVAVVRAVAGADDPQKAAVLLKEKMKA